MNIDGFNEQYMNEVGLGLQFCGQVKYNCHNVLKYCLQAEYRTKLPIPHFELSSLILLLSKCEVQHYQPVGILECTSGISLGEHIIYI